MVEVMSWRRAGVNMVGVIVGGEREILRLRVWFCRWLIYERIDES